MPTHNIELVRVYESPPDDLVHKPWSTFVHIKIDGYDWKVGGLPILKSRQEVLDYLKDTMGHDELFRKATLEAAKPAIQGQGIERLEWVDNPPRDLEVEIDELKAKVKTLEAHQL